MEDLFLESSIRPASSSPFFLLCCLASCLVGFFSSDQPIFRLATLQGGQTSGCVACWDKRGLKKIVGESLEGMDRGRGSHRKDPLAFLPSPLRPSPSPSHLDPCPSFHLFVFFSIIRPFLGSASFSLCAGLCFILPFCLGAMVWLVSLYLNKRYLDLQVGGGGRLQSHDTSRGGSVVRFNG